MAHGLITRIEDNFMIVMTDQMTIDKLKPRTNVKVGQRIEFTKRDIYRGFLLFNYKRASSMLALILVLILTSIVALGQNNTREIYAVVSIDINPSIELNLDQSGIVIGYKSYNEDGRQILNRSLLNKDLEDALSQIILLAQDKAYLVDRDMILLSSTVLKRSDTKLNTTQDLVLEEQIESYMVANRAKYQFVYIEGVERAEDTKSTRSLGRETLDPQAKDHNDINLSRVEAIVGDALPNADMNNENPVKIILRDDSTTYDILTQTRPLIVSTRPTPNDILTLAQGSLIFTRSNHDNFFLEEINYMKRLPPQASNRAYENINMESDSDSDSEDKAAPKQEQDNNDPTSLPSHANDQVQVSKPESTEPPEQATENDQSALPRQAIDQAQVTRPESTEPPEQAPEKDQSALPSQASDEAQVAKPKSNEPPEQAPEKDQPSLPSQASDEAQVVRPENNNVSKSALPASNTSSPPTPPTNKPSTSPNPNSKR